MGTLMAISNLAQLAALGFVGIGLHAIFGFDKEIFGESDN